MHKKNIVLIIGFVIPLVMVALVAALIYIPGKLHKPTVNFLYSNLNEYATRDYYYVSSGKLRKSQPRVMDGYVPGQERVPELFIYDVTTGKSTEVSFENTENLTLDRSNESPDGYRVMNANENNSVFSLFGGNYSNDMYLVGHNASRKLVIPTTSMRFYETITFLGWISK